MGAEAYFTSLSKRQSMLLLTAVTFGGQDCLKALDYLYEPEAEVLKHRAVALLQIAREKRIPMLVTEIKRLLLSQKDALWAADPARLAQVLRQERPAVVQLLLRAFPVALAEAVRKQLPPMRFRLRPGFEVQPEVLNTLRWKLGEVLERAGARRGHFKFSDVLRLQSRELLTLCDQMGARLLSQAIAGLPDAEREAFLTALPPAERQVAAKYVAAAGQRKLGEKESREMIALHDANGQPLALRSAGAQRLARACLAQSAEFAARLLEKYRGEFGVLLGQWIRQERQRSIHRGDGGRSEIVGEMERLELAGLIAKPVSLLPAAFKALAISRPPLPKPPTLAAGGPPLTHGRPSVSMRIPLLGPPPGMRDWVAERVARSAGAATPRSADKKPRADITAPLPPKAPAVQKPPALKGRSEGTALARRPRDPADSDASTEATGRRGGPKGRSS